MTDLELELASLYRLQSSPRAALPLSIRVLDRLTELLVLTDELLVEFQTEEANALLWIEPHVRRVSEEIDSAVKRLAQ